MAKSNDGEIVDWNESEDNVREEVNRRTAKAGHTTKYGEPASSGRSIAGPLSKKGKENYRRIFGHD